MLVTELLFLDAGDLAAIDADHGAGNVGSALARKKRNHVAIFFRFAVTADWNTASALG
jgi:hypothetical protein